MSTPKKNIVIFSMTGGFGHIRAGQALLEFAQEHLPQALVTHVNIADMSPALRGFFSVAYDSASKKLPFLWGALYKASDSRSLAFVLKQMFGAQWSLKRKFTRYLLEKKPDGIIFTNVISLSLFSPSIKKTLGNVRIGLVITDYHGHPYYKFSFVDYYFVPTAQVKEDLERAGIDSKKIKVTGIPVDPKFYVESDAQQLRVKHGVPQNIPVVLLIASFRTSKKKLAKVARELLEFTPKIHLIISANGNDEVYDELRNVVGNSPNVLLVRWATAMEEYIKMADVVITKAGGLTVSECLTLKKSMIMVNPIPGQEEYNAQFVEENGFGKKVTDSGDIIKVLPAVLLNASLPKEAVVPQENPAQKIFEYFV